VQPQIKDLHGINLSFSGFHALCFASLNKARENVFARKNIGLKSYCFLVSA
jgi:hypothetical protein